MATYEFNENVKFILPAGFVFTRDEDDEGNESVSIKTGEYENDDGETDYKYSWLIKYKEYDSEEADEGFTSDKLIDWMVERMEATKYMRLPGTPRSILMTKAMPVTVFGRMLKMFVSLCMFQVDDWAAMQLIHTGRYNDDDPYSNTERYENFYEVLKSVRIKGEKLPLEGISASDIEEALYLTFEEEGDAIDVSPTLKINVSVGNQTASYEYTSAGMKKVGQFSFTEVEPDEELYPHYSSIKNNPLRFFPGAVINATGTEFEFHRLDSAYDFESDDKQKQIQEICELNPSGYSLAEIAKEMIPVFRVDKEIFDPKHDRECELLNNYMRRAYMMSALRSFAWTLADYCEEHDTSPEDIDSSLPSRIANFVASRDWLNYDGDSYCQGLCSGSDLHVYFLPDAVSEADKKTFLPSQDDYDRIEEMKASFPSYREILCEVHSLEALRKDLEYIYPAVRILYDELKEARDTSVPLEGNESDIVYAWIALAIAAEFPFFSEDGPMGYAFSWPGEDYKERAKEEKAVYAQREYEAWMNKYEEYIEKDPLIDFDGTLFVFSGLGRGHAGEKDDPIVQMVIEKGGQYRSKVSGITNYLVVDPWHSGYSKIDAAIEQNDNGKHIKIILLEDLEKALGLSTSSTKASSSSSKKSIADNNQKNLQSSSKSSTPSSDFSIDDTGTLIYYLGSDENVILPEGILAIGEGAFRCNDLKSIKFPNSLLKIGKEAFHYCNNLETIFIPEGVESIDERAFSGCKALKRVTLPSSIRTIGKEAFERTAITKIIIPDGCVEIGKWCFDSCADLIAIYIPASVSKMEDLFLTDQNNNLVIYGSKKSVAESFAQEEGIPFVNSSNLDLMESNTDFLIDDDGTLVKYRGTETDIVLPNGIKKVYSAFKKNINITSVVVPDGVETIGAEAFYLCENLRKITLPNSIQEIGENAFRECSNLREITLPNSIQEIGDYAFCHCINLKSIDLPNSIHKIGKFTFNHCTKLKNIVLPATIQNIGRSAFFNSGIMGIVISESCSEIGSSCFARCSSLLNVFVSDSVKVIGENAFSTCNRDTIIHTIEGCTADISAKNSNKKVEYDYSSASISSYYSDESSNTISEVTEAKESMEDFEIDDNGILVNYRGNATDVTLPDGINAIGEYAFFENETITSVVIPEAVKIIKRSAFEGCMNIESATLPSSIQEIEKEAFYLCCSIVSIVIPDGCTKMGDSCFSDCYQLVDIYIPTSVTSIGEYAISTDNDSTVIHTSRGSAADKYAQDNNITVDYPSESSKKTQTSPSSSITSNISSNTFSKSSPTPTSKTGMTQNISNDRMTEPEPFDDLDNETLVEPKAVFKPSISNSASNSTSSSLNSKPQQTAPTKKEGCYIATAVYGSYDAPQVVTLRKFRDETLSNTVFGRWFIRTYYRLSPPIAEKLKNANRINRFVRYILDRWVDKLNSEQ